MDEIRPTEVEGCFGLFFGHAQLRPPHVDPYKLLNCDTKKKASQSVIKLFSEIIDVPCLTDTFCDSVGQWILFCVGSLLSYERQRDFYMLLNWVRAQKSIIQLPSLGELQYNNGYWWNRTDQGTSGKLKE